MRTDELRGALDALAGDTPAPEAAYARVLQRARVQRRRHRLAIGALVVCVAAVAFYAVILVYVLPAPRP